MNSRILYRRSGRPKGLPWCGSSSGSDGYRATRAANAYAVGIAEPRPSQTRCTAINVIDASRIVPVYNRRLVMRDMEAPCNYIYCLIFFQFIFSFRTWSWPKFIGMYFDSALEMDFVSIDPFATKKTTFLILFYFPFSKYEFLDFLGGILFSF